MNWSNKPTYISLFLSFLRLGCTAFGGPAMIAYIKDLSVNRNQWLDEDTFKNGVALCQTIPGATAMQAAAYVGLKVRGVIGAIASFIGFGLPAFLMMLIFSALYIRTRNLALVVSAFTGLQVIIVGIIANAAVSFGRTTLKEWKHIAIAGFSAVLLALHTNPILVILLAAISGILIIYVKQQNSTTVSLNIERTTQPVLFIMLTAAAGFFMLFFFQPELFKLAVLMFKVDLFAFGGGFASVPLIFHEVVEVRQWMNASTLMDGIILGQVTPGPIVITATFVGYLLQGIPGGIVGTISVFLPSFLMVITIAPCFDRLRTSDYFNKFVSGILCSFVGLLITVTGQFASNVQWNIPGIIIFCASFIALLLKTDILWVVLIGTVVSLFISF